MKKIAITIIMALFIMMPNVASARLICTNEAQTAARINASNIKLSYELVNEKEIGYYFKVYYMNLTEDLEIVHGERIYSYNKDSNKNEFTSSFAGGDTYEFDVRIGYGQRCAGYVVSTKKIKVPKFNEYSLRHECIEYEEFALCNKYYEGDIASDDYFETTLEAYKESLNKEEPTPTQEDIRGIFEKIIDYYVENLIWTIPLTVIIVGGICAIVIVRVRRRKNRAKIKI